MRVAATGGKPETLPLEGDEKSLRWPRFLPDGRHYLVEIRRANPAGSGPLVRATFLASLDSTEKRQILSDDRSPTYAPPGFLLFGRADEPHGGRLRPEVPRHRGEPVALASRIEGFVAPGSPYFSVYGRSCSSIRRGSDLSRPRLFWWVDPVNPPVPVGPAGQPVQRTLFRRTACPR